MKKFILAIIFLGLSINVTNAAGKYQGSGELKLNDYDVEWFLQYLKAPAGQSPMVFWVLSENGKSIWAASWYCPAGNCQASRLGTNARKCKEGAEKFYKRFITEECKLFARKRVIIWKNGINPARGKVSTISSKSTENELRAKLTELGFLGDTDSSNDTTNSKSTDKKKITKKDSSQKISNDVIESLKDLKKLFDDGIITEEEFTNAKKKILN